ncbi:MAG: hypothetical protein M0Z65_11530 [Firmicutes bacterium]|nr:hypothetical protein [Melghirimyces thermohalophilus]MDA8353784.1 hypothetical protein [Bacillota bacterium]
MPVYSAFQMGHLWNFHIFIVRCARTPNDRSDQGIAGFTGHNRW